MKKRLLVAILLIAALAGTVSCGKANPVVQETSLGVNLENKAKDVTGQQAEDTNKTDDMLDSIPTE